jgi:hypothetical protein
MTDHSQIIDSLMKSAFVPAITDNRYHDALVVSVLIYLMSQSGEDRTGAAALVHEVASTILEKEQGLVITKSCSFCGEKPPKVTLVMGGGNEKASYICNVCVDMIYAGFHKEGK